MDGTTVTEIERLAQKAAGKIVSIDGREYSTTSLHDPRKEVKPPATLVVATLSGLVGYIEDNRDGLELGKCLLHIAGPDQVQLLGPLTGEFNQRFGYVRAQLQERLGGFAFDRFHSREEFNIALQARFAEGHDKAYVLKLISSILEDGAVKVKDDGQTQNVETRKGIALADTTDIRNPVTLAPYRTFHEVTQPPSPFILRVRAGPTVALFEADGGAWRLDAIDSIRDYFSDHEGISAAGVKVIG